MNRLTPDAFVAAMEGGRAGVLTVEIPESAPDIIREGIARRRIVLAGGQCPCGAQITMPTRQQRRAAARWNEPIRVTVFHARDCPAGAEVLYPAIDEWQATT